jgi:hypothetical protein
MWGVLLALPFACAACDTAPQPDSIRTVAAFEVPLSNGSDRDQLIAILRQDAGAEGFHVDAASADELRNLSEVSPITINAAVWRGKDDDEAVASVMDGPTHLGLALLTFSRSTEPRRTARYRERAMRRIMLRWPRTQALPIMPDGAIPFHDDLVATPQGYRVKREAASRYELAESSPLVAGK